MVVLRLLVRNFSSGELGLPVPRRLKVGPALFPVLQVEADVHPVPDPEAGQNQHRRCFEHVIRRILVFGGKSQNQVELHQVAQVVEQLNNGSERPGFLSLFLFIPVELTLHRIEWYPFGPLQTSFKLIGALDLQLYELCWVAFISKVESRGFRAHGN